MPEKVSVITIVKDHEKGLVATLDSLVSQSFVNWESVIVVGPSNDDTLSEALKIKSANLQVLLVNQKSNGIYQAMNEGIEAATGKYLIFMNAGDTFSDVNSLHEMFSAIVKYKKGIVIGGYRVLGQGKKFSFSEKTVGSLKFAFNRRFGCHQAMIFSRSDVVKFCGYDTAYKLCADYKLILQILKQDGGIRVSNVFAAVEPGGISDRSLFNVHNEKHKIRIEFFGKLIWLPSLIWRMLILTRVSLKKSLQTA